MAVIDDLKALAIASSADGGPFCSLAAEGLLTGSLAYASSAGGHPLYFMEGEGGGPGPGGGTISRSFPGWKTERTFPPVPVERTFPL